MHSLLLLRLLMNQSDDLGLMPLLEDLFQEDLFLCLWMSLLYLMTQYHPRD